jgi:beta-glucosidase
MLQMFHVLRSATSRWLVGVSIVACLLCAAAGAEGLAVPAATGAPQRVAWPALQPAVAADPRVEARIADLLRQLTLEQKVAQMVQPDIRYVTPDDVRKYRLGSILNGGGAFPAMNKHADISDWVVLADRFYDASMDASQGAPAIPVFWGTDAVHGHNNVIGATLFPHNVGLGAAHDPDLIQRIGEVTAEEVAVTGIDWTFAPTVAVVRDARWGRSYEGYSDRPQIVRAYAGRMVQGLQGTPGTGSFLDGHHVLATAKHYIGDGGTDRGIDRGDNLSSEQGLLDIHAQGYISAIQAGVQTIMASYNSWQGPKVHGQHFLIEDVLKTRMGFDGLVVSDWDGIDDVQSCSKDKCAQAVNAGIDLFMVPDRWKEFIQNTVAQVRAGDISEARIDAAVTRILRVKIRDGLFDKGRPSSRPLANKRELLGSPAHRAVARQAVRESLVLLKNDGNVLPLRRKLRVLVAGDGADNIEKQTGGWTLTWQGTENPKADFPGATSIFEGIRATVATAGGSATLSPDGSYRSKPDVAIVVFGENPYAEWHGDLRSLDYRGPDGNPAPDLQRPSPETPVPGQWAPPALGAPVPMSTAGNVPAAAASDPDLALLQRLRQSGIPVVAVFLTGRVRGIDPELQASNAFVVAWLPGSEGGGVADVLFRNEKGGVNSDFNGKLSYDWPSGGGPDGTAPAREKPAPLFPYGFGLRYCNQHCDAPLSREPWQTQQSLTSQNTPASP